VENKNFPATLIGVADQKFRETLLHLEGAAVHFG
jgi:hypothetical protein